MQRMCCGMVGEGESIENAMMANGEMTKKERAMAYREDQEHKLMDSARHGDSKTKVHKMEKHLSPRLHAVHGMNASKKASLMGNLLLLGESPASTPRVTPRTSRTPGTPRTLVVMEVLDSNSSLRRYDHSIFISCHRRAHLVLLAKRLRKGRSID